MSSRMKSRCTNPDVGRKVFRWAMLRSSVEPEVEEEVDKHIEECQICSDGIKKWLQKGDTARLMQESDRVLKRRLSEDERIDEKEIASGTALFRYRLSNPAQGMLIKIDQRGDVTDVLAVAFREEFNALK